MAPEDFFEFVPEIGMCRGGLANQLTSLESWILGEGRPAMGISFSAGYMYFFREAGCPGMWILTVFRVLSWAERIE